MKLKRSSAIRLFIFTLALLLGVAGLSAHLKEDRMSAKIMMYYGDWSPEEIRFDSTKWFSSGMYRPRMMGTPAEASPVTMLRNSPDTLQALDNDTLLATALVAIEDKYPEVDTHELMLYTPDLKKQIRYVYSFFEVPDKPFDTYWLFLTIKGETYVVTFNWNVVAKELDPMAMAALLVKGSDEEIIYLELEKALNSSSVSKR